MYLNLKIVYFFIIRIFVENLFPGYSGQSSNLPQAHSLWMPTSHNLLPIYVFLYFRYTIFYSSYFAEWFFLSTFVFISFWFFLYQLWDIHPAHSIARTTVERDINKRLALCNTFGTNVALNLDFIAFIVGKVSINLATGKVICLLDIEKLFPQKI